MSEENTCYYDFGDYRLDIVNYRLLNNDRPVPLTQKSFEILQTLIENRDRVVKKEELLNLIWDDCYVEDATLTQHIYMLRKTLKQHGDGANLIETVPKLGYRFTAEVREVFPGRENGKKEETEFEELLFSETVPEEETFAGRAFDDEVEYRPKILPAQNSFSKKAVLFASVFGVFAFYIGLSVYLSINGSPVTPPSGAEKIDSIAVLPFKQIDEEKDEKLGVGMADVLISKLGNGDDLRVLPTGSVIRYTDEDLSNLSNIGRELGVGSVLTGTIQREGEEIRVTAHLYDVRRQRSLWTGKFDEKFSNIFSVQDAISEQIASELAGKIRNADFVSGGDDKYTRNLEAHQAYSMGLFHWNKRTEDGLKKAIADFQTAIEKDPEFTLAHAYLADAYTLVAYYGYEFITPEEARKMAAQAAERALELDPLCSEALTVMAVNLTGRENAGKSFELLKKAIEVKPNNATAHQRIAWQYAARGDIEKALEEMQTAQNLDPQARNTNVGLATILNYARRPDEAMIYSRRVLELDPSNVMAKFNLAESHEQKGDYREAERIFKEIPPTDKYFENARAALSRIYAKTSRISEAKKILNELTNEKNSDGLAYDIALVYAALGNKRAAFAWLEKCAFGSGGLVYFYINNDYNLDPLRGEGKLDKYSG